MLCPLGADGAVIASGLLATTGPAEGLGAVVDADSEGFGFVFCMAVSLLTRTDAGTMAVSSGVCCANGLFTTVDAADLT